ncbi:MAG: glycosyltransferase family 4 protein [Candidatus Bathyarchaeia archaeon]
MNVLLLTDFFPPAFGGVATHVAALATGLAGRGHNVEVLAVADHDACVEYRGVQVKWVKSTLAYVPRLCRSTFAPPFADARLAMKLSEETHRLKPDVIHAHGRAALTLGILRHRFEDTALVATFHDYFFCCPKSSLLTERSEPCDAQRVSPRCLGCLRQELGALRAAALLSSSLISPSPLGQLDALIAVSEFQASIVKKRLGASAITVSNFIDPRTYSVNGESSGPSRRVLFLGALRPHKGVHVLLAAFRELRRRRQAYMTLVGYPDYPPAWPSAGVEVLTKASLATVEQKLRECALLVVPSVFHDPCPTVALEGMLFKKPVVASRVGGLPEIVSDGETGILVEPGDPKGLASAMERLLADPDEASQMGERGWRRLTDHFTSDVILPRLERVYKEHPRPSREAKR